MFKSFHYLKGARRYMLAAVVLNLAFAGMNIWYTDIFRRYFNSVQGGNTGILVQFAVSLISLELLMTVSHYISSICANMLQRRTMRRMQETLLDHFLRAMSVSIDQRPVGELSALISNDVEVASSGISSGAVRFFHLITRFGIYTGYLFYLNWQMALITLTIGPLMLLLGKIFTGPIEKRTKELREAEAACEENVLSALQALNFIKINRLAGFFGMKYRCAWEKREKSSMKNDGISVLYDELTSFLGVVGSVLILAAAAVLLAKGQLLVGTVVAYLQLHNEIVWPFIEMSSLWRQLVGSKVSVERIEEALRMPAEEAHMGESLQAVDEIHVKKVSFSYDEQTNVLSDVDFSAKKGEIVCLLGENGAGKSTLLKVLCGLYLPDSGEVMLDNTCLRPETMHLVRSAYSFVMQHEHVFDGTIRENLLFGKHFDQKRIEKCAARTGLDAYVESLADGYDTQLTNGSLSGGELKKLSLTRMLLNDAPIVVLDEPFAHLDAEGCELLLAILNELRRDRIVLLVTHNQELVQYADRVVRLENGKII